MEKDGKGLEEIREESLTLYYDRIFELVMMTGEILLKNGAEIFRVQETMTIIAKAYQASNIDIFAISNGIFMSMNIAGNGRNAQIKHIPIAPVHLGRVAAVNNLSRDIALGKYTVEEATGELKKISEIPYAPNGVRVLFAGIGSACFCYILGGSISDSIVSFVAGFLLYIFLIYTDRAMTPKVLNNVLGGAFVTIISIILYTLGLGDNFNQIMIGSIICLIPGVAFTTSVRDFFNGDYLSGTIHLVDALLVATSISVGVGVVMTLWRMIS